MKVLIATPAYGGVVHTTYHESVLRTVGFFAQEFPAIRFESKIISISMLTTARNIFASLVLNDQSYTHLLFVDADMGFAPSLIAKMLAFRKPLVGIVAPARKVDTGRLMRARMACDNDMTARLVANQYIAGDGAMVRNMNAEGQSEIEVVDGFVRVTHTGTGIMLVERTVFETLREKHAELWIPNPPEHVRHYGLKSGGYLQCFEPLRDKDGIAMGEDVSFCIRWVQDCKGEIWANVDEAIAHVGNETFVGQYLTKMKNSPSIRLKVINSAESTSIVPPAAVPEERRLTRRERRAMHHPQT